jgi:anti-sigma factor RsiW
MSACNRIGLLLDGYYDRELGSLERWRVERHLARCGACRHDLASLEAVGGCVRAAVAGQAEPDFWAGIAGRLAPAPVTRRAPRRSRFALPGLVTAAAAAAAAALFVDLELPTVATDTGEGGVVRSIFANERPVVLLEAERSDDSTIIWLMDEHKAPVQEVSTRVGI